ncbi:hypothetical protein PVK06_008334 [Gossypium arboreum]|uniref:Uncharacterized protein n=1 Tax=Gossypium arboreum TaxID=29729 RepID=A0ABR0QJV9_GOSAR|nr:hypothetical protein PVK06_008334 [Gossypium arboreum]
MVEGEDCRQEQIEIDEAKEKNINLSSSVKAMRKKGQRESTSPNEAQEENNLSGSNKKLVEKSPFWEIILKQDSMDDCGLDFLNIGILKNMGRCVGPLLRVDDRTLMGVRSRYACMWIQVNLNNPLPRLLMLKEQGSSSISSKDHSSLESPPAEEQGYGPWMLVQRKSHACRGKDETNPSKLVPC